MFGSIIRKKLSDDQLTNVFLNGIFDVVENGFPLISEMINEDQAFVKSPKLDASDNAEFTMILVAANVSCLESTFETTQATRIEQLLFSKLAKVMQCDTAHAENTIRIYQKDMQRVNHPSKNVVYGISKMVFFKYDLNDFQDDYFKRLQAPNPLFLKRMDQVVENFLWDWDAFFKKYKIEE